MNPQTPISCFVDRKCVKIYLASFEVGGLVMGVGYAQ